MVYRQCQTFYIQILSSPKDAVIRCCMNTVDGASKSGITIDYSWTYLVYSFTI